MREILTNDEISTLCSLERKWWGVRVWCSSVYRRGELGLPGFLGGIRSRRDLTPRRFEALWDDEALGGSKRNLGLFTTRKAALRALVEARMAEAGNG